MGRCSEDGQSVLFESTTDQAVDLFCDLDVDVWYLRLAHLCADVHAIYTPDLSPDFRPVARDISAVQGQAYYELVCDDPSTAFYRNGKLWEPRRRRESSDRATFGQIQAAIFAKSNAAVDGQLWRIVKEFTWGDFQTPEFLLER